MWSNRKYFFHLILNFSFSAEVPFVMSAVLIVVRTNFFITYLYDQEILKDETHWPQGSM